MGSDLPAGAVAAATEAVAKVHDEWYHSSPPVNRACAEAALEAAAPALRPQAAHSWTPETRSAYEAGRKKGQAEEAERAAADEREACARLAEAKRDECVYLDDLGAMARSAYQDIADLIRARAADGAEAPGGAT